MLMRLESHLKETKKKSPFTVMCKKMTSAASKDSKAHAKTFQRKIDNVFKDIVWQFDNMIDAKGDDEGEEELKEAIKEFLVKAESDFKDIKMDLKRIKRRYGM